MAISREVHQTPIIPKAQFYENFRIGRSRISKRGNMNVPKQVTSNYGIQKGDSLEWYPCGIEFPDELESNIIAILIVRRKTDKSEKKE